MSLGQLTAYADSDVEDEVSGGEEEKATSPSISSSLKDTDSKNSKDVADEPQSKNDAASPSDEKEDSFNAGLSGIIEDEDDVTNQPTRPTPPRVSELKASEGGGSSNKSSPASVASGGSGKNTPAKKVNRLVSYNDEDMEDTSSSDDENDEVLHSEPMDTGSTDGEEDANPTHSGAGSKVTSHPSSPGGTPGTVVVDGIKLPSPPRGKKCPKPLQDRIARAVSEVSKGLRNYNAIIQNNKDFRNPSIYEKLVDHLRLDENGTNYPVALYDPHCWGKESFYEALAKSQKEEMEKREKERKERTKVDIMSGTKKVGGEEETKKRKSRFDSGRPEGSAPTAVTKPVSLVSNISTSSLSGAKTTIDAFGGLSKKLKA